MTLDIRGICPLLQVFDMPESLAFYRDKIGFTVIASAPKEPRGLDEYGWAWLRHGSTELMLNTLHDPDDERPPARDPKRVAAHEDTILYIGCPDVDGAYQQLRELGIEVEPPRVAYYGMKQLYFIDPDGFALCFQWQAEPGAEVR
jgi:catechol 2,3-dioxygenase-like lactoylglutathione lyase family enzyme